ncbi:MULTISPECIES: hypothetical protein [unclassified Roseobacter]|uniref:hypothetical protein n=1 Tax=unclassified Roseobacter TaxID=196798 RepID=UPI0018A30ABC|nr:MULTISPECIES: hypothetical protein [unclassified Roseobacter]MDW3183601.1 hypothetical protein [Roseobacter sp.]
MTKAGLVSDALILAPAIWACSFLLRSRWYEREADRLMARDADEHTVQLKREEARYYQDFARVMPNYMLAALTLGLAIRAFLILQAMMTG